jgi:hypothetical protein
MSLDKAIKYCKEHRKNYTGAAAWDATCRPHGGCPWCEDNRTHQDQKARAAADEELKNWEPEHNELWAQNNKTQ